MYPIKSFLKADSSYAKGDPLPEYEEDTLFFPYQFMYDHDPACEYHYDKELKENPKQDKNELMADIIDRMSAKHQSTRDMVVASSHFYARFLARHSPGKISKPIGSNHDANNLWFITLTVQNNTNEGCQSMMKYFNKHLAKYKKAYTLEKDSAESGRWHIHAIVEGEYFHTKKNLRPTKYYAGNINIVKITTDNGTMNYISKEKKPDGDVEYIQNQLKKLRKNN